MMNKHMDELLYPPLRKCPISSNDEMSMYIILSPPNGGKQLVIIKNDKSIIYNVEDNAIEYADINDKRSLLNLYVYSDYFHNYKRLEYKYKNRDYYIDIIKLAVMHWSGLELALDTEPPWEGYQLRDSIKYLAEKWNKQIARNTRMQSLKVTRDD